MKAQARRAGKGEKTAPRLLGLALASIAALSSLAFSSCAKQAAPEEYGARPLLIWASEGRDELRFIVDEYRDRRNLRILVEWASPEELLARLRTMAAAETPTSGSRADILWGRIALDARSAGLGTADLGTVVAGKAGLAPGAPNRGAAETFLGFVASEECRAALTARFGSYESLKSD